MAITLGIDVSWFQGPIDWDKVGATAYDFALTRMTRARPRIVDDLGHRNLSEMIFRVPVAGAYGVVGDTGGIQGAADGAKFLVDEIAKDVDPHAVLVMLDAENFADGTHPTIEQVDQYATTIHDRLGHWPIAYVPGWWMRQHGYSAKGRNLANCPWAQSHYLSAPWTETKLEANKPALQYGFESLAWLQYTSSASVSGVSGRVDANVFYGTGDQLRAQLIGGIMSAQGPEHWDDADWQALDDKRLIRLAQWIGGKANQVYNATAVGVAPPAGADDVAAVLAAVKAVAPTLDQAQLEQLAALVATQLVIKGAGYTGTVDLSPKPA